jgi:hypothetical protein
VDALIKEMNKSIEEAGQFLRRLDEEARGIYRGGLARGRRQRDAAPSDDAA